MSEKDYNAEFEEQEQDYDGSDNDNDDEVADNEAEATAKAPAQITPLVQHSTPPTQRKAKTKLYAALLEVTRQTNLSLSPIEQKAPKLTKATAKAFIEFRTAYRNLRCQ